MNSGGLVRLTRRRSVPGGEAGVFTGSAVDRTLSWAGSATAPADSSPRSHNATCTAQSVRPGSPNSLVPSSGSTIQTRSADNRSALSLPSSDKIASAGRSRASSLARNSCANRSPALRRSSPDRDGSARSSSSLRPAVRARSRASSWSEASSVSSGSDSAQDGSHSLYEADEAKSPVRADPGPAPAASRARLVHLILGHGQPSLHQDPHGVGRPAQDLWQLL